jgi:origin recognition complex subunit 6
MPGVRAICDAFAVPAVASHVFAGVSSVARSLATASSSSTAAAAPTSRKRQAGGGTGGGFAEELLPALIFVITSYVAAQFEAQLSGEEYLERRDKGFEVLARHAPFAELDKKEFVATVEKYLREGRESGWFEMPWFENVEDAAEGWNEMDVDDTESGEGEGEEVRVKRKRKATNDFDDEGTANARRGGGEMRMYALDWLSEERKREFDRWKATVQAELNR